MEDSRKNSISLPAFLIILGIFGCLTFGSFLFSRCSDINEQQNNTDTIVEDTLCRIQIINASDSDITVYITLGSTPGCLQQASDIPFVTDTIGLNVGYFILHAGDSTICYAPEDMGFNGNITFNSQPINCPTNTFPNATNLFEFIINNAFQPGIPQNSVDISCVAGANCVMKVYLDGGSAWNASDSFPDVDSIYNAGVLLNSGLPGVFPYGCDTCTGAKNPPSCAVSDKDKQKLPICNVQRDAIGAGGGVIRVVFIENL